jgi:hypothetical protein
MLLFWEMKAKIANKMYHLDTQIYCKPLTMVSNNQLPLNNIEQNIVLHLSA